MESSIQLKNLLREQRDNMKEGNAIRIHWTIIWLNAKEEHDENLILHS